MVIVHTTVWIDYFQGTRNPETDWLDAELDRQRLGVTDIILCELLQGVRDEATAAMVERRLLAVEVFETGGIRAGASRRAQLPDASQPGPHRAQDDRLPDRHVLPA